MRKQHDGNTSLTVQACVDKLNDEIDLVRQTAWSAWKRSQSDKVKTTEKQTIGGPGGGRSEETIVTESQVGDAAFLRLIIECNKREATLRGLEKSKHVLFQVGQTSLDIDMLLLQLEAAEHSLPAERNVLQELEHSDHTEQT